MSLKKIVVAILNAVIRLSISCVVVVAVYRLAMYSYHFGFMVFNDAAKETSPGRDITISVEMDDNVMKIGQTLASRGLIEDARIFYVQERLSEYHEKIEPGVYTLNTSMRPSELIATMANKDQNLEDEEDADNQLISNSELQDPTKMDDGADTLMEGEAAEEENLTNDESADGEAASDAAEN